MRHFRPLSDFDATIGGVLSRYLNGHVYRVAESAVELSAKVDAWLNEGKVELLDETHINRGRVTMTLERL